MNYPKCEDCKFCNFKYIAIYHPEFNTCTHPETAKYCDVERVFASRLSNVCGREGRFFVPISRKEKLKKHFISATVKNPTFYCIVAFAIILLIIF